MNEDYSPKETFIGVLLLLLLGVVVCLLCGCKSIKYVPVESTVVIVAGDCGFGFHRRVYYDEVYCPCCNSAIDVEYWKDYE